MSPQSFIVSLLREECRKASERHLKCAADHAACIAKSEAWGGFNSDDGVGGISVNPFDTSFSQKRLDAAKERVADAEAAYAFAVDAFIPGT